MREFTKSMISFTWSMSLFGINQLISVMKPPGKKRESPGHPATASFNAAAEATEAQLSGFLKGAYKVGDQFQREMVDMLSSTLKLDSFNPGKMFKLTSDLFSQVVPGLKGAASQQYEPMGWGPVPAAEEP